MTHRDLVWFQVSADKVAAASCRRAHLCYLTFRDFMCNVPHLGLQDEAMSEQSGSEQHQGGVFVTTRWSMIAGAGESDSTIADEALERLCATYWHPVFVFVRRSVPNEHAAKDLTQGFFEKFLLKEYFRDADRNRGRFRSFLLTCVKHFMANEWNKQRAQRRGGGATHFSVEQLIEETGAEPESESTLSPDRNYERQWALSLLEQVKSKLRREFEDANRKHIFDAIQGYLSGGREVGSYQAVAEKLEMSTDAVKKNVERMRRRFGHLLREEIAETVLHPSEIEDELRFLRNALKS